MNTDLILSQLTGKSPELEGIVPTVNELGRRMIAIFDGGRKLFVAGNGGSAADAQHIVGELMKKSFVRKRQLSEGDRASFDNLPHGGLVAANLEAGLPAIALRCNQSLTSAILYDFSECHLEFAQELWVLADRKDAFIGISTSGRALNVLYAMATARAKGLYTVAFTGREPSPIGEIAETAVCVPAAEVSEIQQLHQLIYHALCKILEFHFF